MSQSSKGRLNYRCPCCFGRDIDMDMFYDEEKHEYYCLRCAFHASEEEVLKFNEMARYRYRFLKMRVTDFGEDNEPLKVAPHKRGEM